jgi:glutaredoxin
MSVYYTIYSLTDCQFCKRAINLLSQKNIPFLVVVMDKNPEFMSSLKQDVGHNTVPIIMQQMEDGATNFIGGSDDLERHLSELETADGLLAKKAIDLYGRNNGTN